MDANTTAGVAAVAMAVAIVTTVVVKLLLEDKISTSWRKAIGEESERRGMRSVERFAPRRSEGRI